MRKCKKDETKDHIEKRIGSKKPDEKGNSSSKKMKKIFLTLIVSIGLTATAKSQVINQITIIPSNPTENDAISVISDFSFYGNCSFGLVNYSVQLDGSTIRIRPFFCGYVATTLCNSIDTFKAGPFPTNEYTISIEYHQGSICPISGFDEIISEFDTAVMIGSSNIWETPRFNHLCKIHPNPADDHLIIDISSILQIHDYHLKIINLLGEEVFSRLLNQKRFEINLSGLDSGIYFVFISDKQDTTFNIRKLAVK